MKIGIIVALMAGLLLTGCAPSIQGCWETTNDNGDRGTIVFTIETFTVEMPGITKKTGTYTYDGQYLIMDEGMGAVTRTATVKKDTLIIEEIEFIQITTLTRCEE